MPRSTANELRLFRPPAEADSLIIRVADGCPHNTCTFCGMYKAARYRVHPPDELESDLGEAQLAAPHARRVFLADGDVMLLPFEQLRHILNELRARLPRLRRVSVYANGSSILAKSETQLTELRQLGLHTLYLGLESGHEPLLKHVAKPETAEQMINAVRRAQGCGLRMSVMILIGLGGQEGSAEHVHHTVEVLNRMQPRLLSALRVIPIPGTRMQREADAGTFRMLSEHEATAELRDTVAGLQLTGTVFRANHSSNIVPLEGRLPRDQARLVAELNALLDAGVLDSNGPGATPLWL